MYAACRRVGVEGRWWWSAGVGGDSLDLVPSEGLGLGTRSERWWWGGGGRGGKGDKKWISVSLSHSLIYFKSEPYLRTALGQALSAPTSAEIFKTINAVQQQAECRTRQAVAV